MAFDLDIDPGETPQVRTRVVVLLILGIFASLALIAFGLEPFFADRVAITSSTRHPFPAPAITPNERARRLALEARQRRLLDGGEGRMPIGQAMATIAAKGAHAFDPLEAKP